MASLSVPLAEQNLAMSLRMKKYWAARQKTNG
jgi:hypothetical protein